MLHQEGMGGAVCAARSSRHGLRARVFVAASVGCECCVEERCCTCGPHHYHLRPVPSVKCCTACTSKCSAAALLLLPLPATDLPCDPHTQASLLSGDQSAAVVCTNAQRVLLYGATYHHQIIARPHNTTCQLCCPPAAATWPPAARLMPAGYSRDRSWTYTWLGSWSHQTLGGSCLCSHTITIHMPLQPTTPQAFTSTKVWFM